MAFGEHVPQSLGWNVYKWLGTNNTYSTMARNIKPPGESCLDICGHGTFNLSSGWNPKLKTEHPQYKTNEK